MPPSRGSSHEPEHNRTLVHEPEYALATEEIFRTVQRADEVLSGLEFFVSRRAEIGMAVRDRAGIASWLSQLLPDGQRVRVLYAFSAHSVHLLDAWTVPGFGTSPYSQ